MRILRSLTRLQLGLALAFLSVALALLPLGLSARNYELGPKQGYGILVLTALFALGAVIVLFWPWLTQAWSWLRRDVELHEAQEAQARLRERLREAEEEHEESKQDRDALQAENEKLITELSGLIAPSGGTATYPLLKRDELSETRFTRRTIHIADFAREVAGLNWKDAVINDRVFEDCHIVGPAVLVPMNTGRVGGFTFVDCRWDESTTAFWVPAENIEQALTGIVGLEDSVFRECRFTRVGVLMSVEEVRERRGESAEPEGEPT